MLDVGDVQCAGCGRCAVCWMWEMCSVLDVGDVGHVEHVGHGGNWTESRCVYVFFGPGLDKWDCVASTLHLCYLLLLYN